MTDMIETVVAELILGLEQVREDEKVVSTHYLRNGNVISVLQELRLRREMIEGRIERLLARKAV